MTRTEGTHEEMMQLVQSLRHVVPPCDQALESAFLKTVIAFWGNATRLSHYSQRLAARHDDDDMSQWASEVVMEASKLKWDVMLAVATRPLPKSLNFKYTYRVSEQYERMRKAAGELGLLVDPVTWGRALPIRL